MKSRIILAGLAVIVGGAAAAYAPSGDYISGRVTDEVTGKPLAGICVYADPMGLPVSLRDEGEAVTQRNGTYRIGGLNPHQYEVTFLPCKKKGYGAEDYNDRPWVSGELFSDIVEPPASRIDAALGPGALISGRVTSAVTGEPLSGVCVGQGFFGERVETTQEDGTFTLSIPYSGSILVSAKSGDCESGPLYASHQGYDRDGDGRTDRVRVRLGEVTRGIEIALLPWGAIEGKLVDRLGGAPIQGACVYTSWDDLYSSDAVFSGYPFVQDESDARGRYRLPELPPGTYYLDFDVDCRSGTGSGWSRWGWSVAYGHPDQPNLNLYDATVAAEPVAVQGGRTTRGIDASLSEGGRISGTILDSTGDPLEGACVWTIFLDGPDRAFKHLLTNSAGRYNSSSLPPGRYAIYVAHPRACEIVEGPTMRGDWQAIEGTVYYGGARTIDDAHVVRVRPGRTTGGIDAEL